MTPDRFIAAAFREAVKSLPASSTGGGILKLIEHRAAELAREGVGDGEWPTKAIVEVAEEAYREAITGMELSLPEWSSLAPMRHALRAVANHLSQARRSVGGDVERDGARYRWLREYRIPPPGETQPAAWISGRGNKHIESDWLTGEHADAAIDAALTGVGDGKKS